MIELTLHGLTEDEGALVLVDPNGAEHRLVVDDALISALRRSRRAHASAAPRSGPTVRPRDIQAMIREGMSAEEVAAETGEDVEHIRTYERPVIDERRHIAAQAGRVLVYPDTDAGSPTALASLARERLELREVDPESMSWDAWKRQDGAWYVELTFVAGSRERTAGWTFSRGSVAPQDDEARWLSDSGPTDSGPIPDFGSAGERGRAGSASLAPAPPAVSRDHQTETGRILESLRRRRGVTAPVSSDPATRSADDRGRTPNQDHPTEPAASTPPQMTGLRLVGDEDTYAIDGAHTAPSAPDDATDSSTVAMPSTGSDSQPIQRQPDQHTEPIGTPQFDPASSPQPTPESPLTTDTGDQAPDDEPLTDSSPGDDHPSLLDDPALDDWTGHGDIAADTSPSESPAKKKRGRASVPSWDEIMFGGRNQD